MKRLFFTVTFVFGIILGSFADSKPYNNDWFIFNLFHSNEIEEEESNNGLFENIEINEMFWGYTPDDSPSIVKFNEGGLFGRGESMNTGLGNGFRNNAFLSLPFAHGNTNDSDAPLGGGVLLLIGFGAAYALKKKSK